MNAVVMTAARIAAFKAVKQELRARGEEFAFVDIKSIVATVESHLRGHPELIKEAAETVRNVPQLRALAEREEQQRRTNSR